MDHEHIVVYNKIVEAYSSTWPDTLADIQIGKNLIKALLDEGIDPQLLIEKARLAGQAHGDFKFKLSKVLISRWWTIKWPGEATSEHQIVVRKFNHDQI